MDNETIIDKVRGWQNDETVHSLTCGVCDERVFTLRAVEVTPGHSGNGDVVLECPKCGCLQEDIPDVVLRHEGYKVSREKRMAARYQNQPWYVKLWRLRFKVTVPYWAVRMWWQSDLEFRNCWSCAMGEADMAMNWVYTLGEVREDLSK